MLFVEDITPSSSAVYVLTTTTRPVIDGHCFVLIATQVKVMAVVTLSFLIFLPLTAKRTQRRTSHERPTVCAATKHAARRLAVS